MILGRISLPMALSANDQFLWLPLIKTGSKQTYIAKKYGATPATLNNWLKMNEIHVKEEF